MAKNLVNLDAMIKRADTEFSQNDADGDGQFHLTITDLKRGKNIFSVLRKPDFQRETREWSPEQVAEIIKNFADRELIPAVILWKSPSRLYFVIDGAHRLSALIAWVNDDYGDGRISQEFFGATEIPEHQIKVAQRTRELVKRFVGDYDTVESAASRTDLIQEDPILVHRSRGITGEPIASQTINSRDPAKAEASFYRINQGGAKITEQEIELIRARRWPQAIAARGLLRAGSGHKYWGHFDPAIQEQIEELAQQCFTVLYKPDLPDTLRTIDLPIAGRGHNSESLWLLYQLIHIANDIDRIPPPDADQRADLMVSAGDDPMADSTGEHVLRYLRGVLRLAKFLCSNSPESLGLHPAVYSYTATGTFLGSAFLAHATFAKEMRGAAALHEFTTHRELFEDHLVFLKPMISTITHDKGGRGKSTSPLLHLFNVAYTSASKGHNVFKLQEAIRKDERLSKSYRPEMFRPQTGGRDVSRQSKAAMRMREELSTALRCPECRARMHPGGRTADHIHPKATGGRGHSDDLQSMHPFCNSGVKTKRLASKH